MITEQSVLDAKYSAAILSQQTQEKAADLLEREFYETTRPSVLFRPVISIDGNQWCALYGDNLQDGVSGFGDSPDLAMRDFDKNWGELIAVYSIVNMKDGEKSREVMSVEEIEAIRKRSRSGNAGPWKTDYPEMAKKTVIRRHSKRLPMSTDLDLDGLVHSDDDLFMPDEPAAAATQGDNQAPARTRPSRLDKVAQQAPQQAEQTITEDGEVIDAEPANVVEDDDIPI